MNKTCKDCIHFDVCDKKHRLSTYHGEMDSRPTYDRKCNYDFKDKSRYIELPCAVGDTVFYIDTCTTAEDFGKKFVNFSRAKRISVDNEFVLLFDQAVVSWENVFLTKEDAEQVLKGGAE